jgi:hypothetical protein
MTEASRVFAISTMSAMDDQVLFWPNEPIARMNVALTVVGQCTRAG